MNAEIISVGTEILLGDIVNTNAQYLSEQLASLGVNVFSQLVIGDNSERLYEAFEKAFENTDIVITTGGLGPTEDDLTKEIGAKYFNLELVLDEESKSSILKRFEAMGVEPTLNNLKQAYLPKDCIKLPNNNGTAPGCIIEKNNKILIMLPGPPKEMKPMFDDSVAPYLKTKQDSILVSKVLRVMNIGESKMETLIKDLIDNQTNPTIAPYAKENEAIIRITAKAKDETEANKLIEPVVTSIKQILSDNIYGQDNDTLEAVVAKLIIEKNMTISAAESCTGGLLAATLVNYAGVSEIFKEGVVTYSNEAKINRLGVKEETLKKYSAVSNQTALEMAEGIAKTANTNIGLSTTGIAGPGGGTKEKPVGLVYVGICINGKTITKELHLIGDRQKIRSKTVYTVLDLLRRQLINL